MTITGMYNVLERLRSGEPLSVKEKVIQEQGLVSVIGSLIAVTSNAITNESGEDFMAGPNKDEIKGKLNQMKGAIKKNVGRATGDAAAEGKGAGQEAGGKLQAGFGEARRKTGNAIKDLGRKIGK